MMSIVLLWGYYYFAQSYTAQKMMFSIKDFFSKCDQIRSFLRIWSHLLKKSVMENFIFCAVLSNNFCWVVCKMFALSALCSV